MTCGRMGGTQISTMANGRSLTSSPRRQRRLDGARRVFARRDRRLLRKSARGEVTGSMETCTYLQASDSTGRNDTSAVLVRRAVRDHGRFHIADGTARRRATPEAEVRDVVGDGCLALRVRADGGRVAEVVTRLSG